MKLKAHHGSPGEKKSPFERWWDETAKAFCQSMAVLQEIKARDQRHQYEEYSTTIKAHRRRVCEWLKKNLTATDEILDVMAGMGHSTVPLIMDGSIQKITLIEAMGMHSLAIKMSEGEIAKEKIELIESPIGSHTTKGSLPTPINVTLIFTGLIFDASDRAGSPEDWTKGHRNPQMRVKGARGHIPPNSRHKVELADVLRGLGDQKRVIWVADAPRLGLKDGATRSRTHVEEILGAVDSGWEIAEWQNLNNNGEEMIFGKLVHPARSTSPHCSSNCSSTSSL